MIPRKTRAELLRILDGLDIAYRLTEHSAVATVDDLRKIGDLCPGLLCKNLFLKDARGEYWLVVVPHFREVDLHALPQTIGSRRLSFASPERLMEVLGVVPGAVTPLALVNDRETRVHVILDRAMLDGEALLFHPLENTATVAVSPADLLRFVMHCGHLPCVVDFGEAAEAAAALPPAVGA